jgi:hypothetical protein
MGGPEATSAERSTETGGQGPANEAPRGPAATPRRGDSSAPADGEANSNGNDDNDNTDRDDDGDGDGEPSGTERLPGSTATPAVEARAPAPPVERFSGEAVPADAELTAAGLVKRRPGAAFGGNAAASAAEQGEFRRLPTPARRDDADRAIAQRRLRVLSELRAGIGRGREEDVDARDDERGDRPNGRGARPDIDLTDDAGRGTS